MIPAAPAPGRNDAGRVRRIVEMTDTDFVPKPIIRVAFGKIEAKILFAWFDLWIGAYWDPKNKSLYVCPLPCCVFYFGKRAGL